MGLRSKQGPVSFVRAGRLQEWRCGHAHSEVAHFLIRKFNIGIAVCNRCEVASEEMNVSHFDDASTVRTRFLCSRRRSRSRSPRRSRNALR